MIQFVRGNLFDRRAEALVNAVNCVGVMGKGIALEFKKAYPENFAAYVEGCERGEIRPGRMFLYETGSLNPPCWIINFPTKRHWRDKSRMKDLEAGLDDLARALSEKKIRSVAMPAIGAGLGGLDWALVRRAIAARLEPLVGVEIIVFEPLGAQRHVKAESIRKLGNVPAGRS